MKSVKKEQLLKEFLSQPIKVGDTCYFTTESGKSKTIKVELIQDDYAIYSEYRKHDHKVLISELTKSTSNVGANPFKDRRLINNMSYSLETMLSKLRLLSLEKYDKSTDTINGKLVKYCNFNPYVILKNKTKFYYQRDYVWNTENQQELFRSIYNNLDAGSILIKENEYHYVKSEVEKGNEEIHWFEVIDGKQRLITLALFINNEISDCYGNYFKDLSLNSQHKLFGYMGFKYCSIDSENLTDEDVLDQFLSVNHKGVSQTNEHIDTVLNVYNGEVKYD